MKRNALLYLSVILSSTLSFGQDVPKKEILQFFKEATERRTSREDTPVSSLHPVPDADYTSGFTRLTDKLKEFRALKIPAQPAGGDTLVIGVPPLDSLTITGSYTHNGPVLVIGNGILRFKNANATIGDLYVWGEHALVTADSSYLYFPQQYFYQRALVIAGGGKVVYHNTTLDHSGLSHNLVVTDSARLELSHVTNIGFTTCGMYEASEIDVDSINQAGEFIILDQSKLSFSHAKTILLWYQVPEAGIFHYSFPDGDTLQSFSLNSSTPGISGIEYDVRVDTSTDIMWGLMPTNGSDVHISDSKIRSVGLWFLGHDSITVSGLVDNSEYTDFTANLNDRSLRITHSSVQTWSLYPMDTVTLDVHGCILGEIGSQARSRVITSGTFVDGSGGFWSASGQSFMAAQNCVAVNAIRTIHDAVFIFAYSTLSQGETATMGNSIMMIVQSQLPEEPVLYDGSCIWYSWIGKSSPAFVDTIIRISGSVWIDKTPLSTLVDFGWYSMYWQKSGDSSWQPIGGKKYTERRDTILSEWDTHGLDPGLYYVKLVLADNTADSILVEAVKAVNVLPGIFGVDRNPEAGFRMKIFPDPVIGQSVIRFFLPKEKQVEISVVDLYGKIIFRTEQHFPSGENFYNIGNLLLSRGCYSCILKSGDRCEVVKFVKM